jgi:hypothetical protein
MLSDLLFWAVVVVFASPIWLALGWEIVEGLIRPHLIPSKEIERLASETMQRYPDDPLGAAGREEHAAWYRSESYEQGKWRRVRKAIARRLSEKDNA